MPSTDLGSLLAGNHHGHLVHERVSLGLDTIMLFVHRKVPFNTRCGTHSSPHLALDDSTVVKWACCVNPTISGVTSREGLCIVERDETERNDSMEYIRARCVIAMRKMQNARIYEYEVGRRMDERCLGYCMLGVERESRSKSPEYGLRASQSVMIMIVRRSKVE